MKTMKIIAKGLLGTSVISLFAAGTALAGGTQAGTSVKNTFTLDYKVGSVDQVQIKTCRSGEAGCTTESSTNFTVDRLVDLTVTSQGNQTVSPGQVDAKLVFAVRNDGNDKQAYDFTLVNEATGDNFNASDISTMSYYLDNGDANVCDSTDLGTTAYAYTSASGVASQDLVADSVICVVVDGDIATTVSDAQTSKISLVATTRYASDAATGAGTVVLADADGTNALIGTEENVLADGTGTSSTGDGNNDGAHSATGTYIVASADLTAVKSVSMFSMDAANCATFPGTPDSAEVYSVPGACVEYKITVKNEGATIDATNIKILDTLPDDLKFIASSQSVFTSATITPLTTNTDCDSGACVVELKDGVLGAGDTGILTIRAMVK